MYLQGDDQLTDTSSSKEQKNNASTDSQATGETNLQTTNETSTPEKEKDNPTQYEGTNPNTSASITGSINYKAVVDSALTLRITIDQALSGGTCTLTLSSNGKTVTKTAPVAANPSSATCEGFSVPISELGNGQWDININVTSGDRSGTLKGTVTI